MRFAVLLALSLLAAADGCAAAAAAPPPATKPDRPTTRPSDDAEPASAEYVEYRYQPELGSITIQAGVVRGAKRVAAFERRARELPQRDIFPMVDPPAAASAERPRPGGRRSANRQPAPDPAKADQAQPADGKRQVYRRRERVDGRRIETLIVLDPPAGRPAAADPNRIPGEGGDDAPVDAAEFWTARVLVRVDGRLKVACTIGTTGEDDDELYIPRVTIYPEDGTLEVTALTAEGEELTLPESWLDLDDRTVITDGSFFEDDPTPHGGGTLDL